MLLPINHHVNNKYIKVIGQAFKPKYTYFCGEPNLDMAQNINCPVIFKYGKVFNKNLILGGAYVHFNYI